MSSQYFPPYSKHDASINVKLDLSNYATKDDVKNITHVDVSSFASKTNLAALKTEVDKLDTNKLKTTPADLAKLTNAVDNELVKKTVYNAKVTTIDNEIPGVKQSATNNLAEITKLKKIDTDSFVTRTKFAADTNSLDDKIDKVEKKIPDISGLAAKPSLSNYLQTTTFNSKVTETEGKIVTVEGKIPSITALATKAEVTAVENKIPSLVGYAKKSEVATDITAVRNDYVSNASLFCQLNDLKVQHIADEVKKVDDKAKKNASDILAFENRLKQKEDTVNENERGISFNRGFFFYMDQSYLVYECKMGSLQFTAGGKIFVWKSAGIFNYLGNSNIHTVGDSKGILPELKNDGRMNVYFSGNHFQLNKVIVPNNNNVINIYCVYKMDPIASTIQNTLFGAMQTTKDPTNNSKNNYKGYAFCFDERSNFSHTISQDRRQRTSNGKNVLIFGADLSSSIHATNRANHIYCFGEGLTQSINDTTIYAEKNYYRNFSEHGETFVLSLHYNGDNSYLFVNGRQELKFKAKNDQLIKEKLCIGNLSDQWTASESEKTGLYGNIYDFAVDCEAIIGVGPIYDMHRFLMTKHNVLP